MSIIYTDSALVASSDRISNLGTMVQRIKLEIHRATSDDDDLIRMAIVSALRHYKAHRFWFNETEVEFNLIIDQQAYSTLDTGFPSDLFKIDAVYVNQSDSWVECHPRPFSYIRDYQVTDSGTGVPKAYAWHAEQIWLAPIPNGTYSLRVDYVKDLGTPSYQFESGVINFYESDDDTSAALVDAYTSDWFASAEELIRGRAKWDLYLNVYMDDANAVRAGGLAATAYAALRKESDGYKHTERTPYLV